MWVYQVGVAEVFGGKGLIELALNELQYDHTCCISERMGYIIIANLWLFN